MRRVFYARVANRKAFWVQNLLLGRNPAEAKLLCFETPSSKRETVLRGQAECCMRPSAFYCRSSFTSRMKLPFAAHVSLHTSVLHW